MNHIQIGPIRYHLKEKSRLHTKGEGLKAPLYGYCDVKASTIVLDKGQSVDMKRITLWHEIIHALCEERKIGIPEDQEEVVIDKLAYALVDILRQNPELIAFTVA